MQKVDDTTRDQSAKGRTRLHGAPVAGRGTGPGSGIRERVFDFAVGIVRLVRALSRDTASQVVARQTMRAGTSVGANVAEAQAADSRREFARKMNIGRAEAVEVRYWLDLIIAAELLPEPRVAELRDEADEIVRVLSSSVKKTRLTDGATTRCAMQATAPE